LRVGIASVADDATATAAAVAIGWPSRTSVELLLGGQRELQPAHHKRLSAKAAISGDVKPRTRRWLFGRAAWEGAILG